MAMLTAAFHPPSFNAAEKSLSICISTSSPILINSLSPSLNQTMFRHGHIENSKVNLFQSGMEEWVVTQMKTEALESKECGTVVRNSKDGSHYYISV